MSTLITVLETQHALADLSLDIDHSGLAMLCLLMEKCYYYYMPIVCTKLFVSLPTHSVKKNTNKCW